MKKVSLSSLITIFVVAAIILCAASVGIFAYVLERNEVIKSQGRTALGIANTVVSALEPELYENIMAALQDVGSDDYDEIMAYMQSLGLKDAYDQYSLFLDKTFDANGLRYLYVLDANYTNEVTYFAEGYPPEDKDDEPELLLGDKEGAEFYDDLMYQTIGTGEESITAISDSGEFGIMISAFSPLKNEAGKVIGVVGVDLPVDDVLATSNTFGLTMIIIVVGVSIIVVITLILLMKRWFVKPIAKIIGAADELAIGSIEIEGLDDGSDPTRNEVIKLERSFSNMLGSFRKQAYILARLAEGDYSYDIDIRSEKDVINLAIKLVLEETLEVLHKVANAGIQVTETSKQIASGAQALAQGSTEQAASVDSLSSSMSEISQHTKENADMANQAAILAETIKHNAEKGSKQMNDMIEAVEKIHQSSQSITRVIKVIDDIAFQTNILALNAAVEAARAGAAGRGFAVVADEVRNLASKSAEAAKSTGSLISNSIEKADLGSRIANETSKSLEEIVKGIIESSKIIGDIAQRSEGQHTGIAEINRGVEQVAQVVQQNTATAEESAAASQEMNNQSVVLDDLLKQFQLRELEKEKPDHGQWH